MTSRKSAAAMSAAEWTAFVAAVDAMHGPNVAAPRYRDFVRVHTDAMTTMTGMGWGVHTMQGMGMVGRNFLAWHRQFLLVFERRLGVAVPYWDWARDRAIPLALTGSGLLRRWGVSRASVLNAGLLPSSQSVRVASQAASFEVFQAHVEALHNLPHQAVGGTMNTAASPADPVFWLHHANIDRIWATWQKTHPAATPANATERLKPRSVFGTTMFGIAVSDVLNVAALGYRYL